MIRRITALLHRERRRSAALLGVGAIAGGIALGVVALGVDAQGRRPVHFPPPRRVALPAPVGGGALRTVDVPRRDHAAVARRRPARPVRVLIPAIGVRAAIVHLGLNRDRTLQTPKNYARAGWYSGGPRPGERGAAVVVGHVDSETGPAVFYALRELRRGDGIRVVGADGRTAHFTVQRLARFPKAKFPTKLVYGATRHRVLRLITCGGSFDTASGHYRDNTIVFARLA